MKRAIISGIMILILFITGCERRNSFNYLSYSVYPFDAHGILTYDGKEYEVLVNVNKPQSIRLQVIKPETLGGMVFSLDDGVMRLIASGVDRVIDNDGYSEGNGIVLATHMFSLAPNDFIHAEVITENGVSYSRAEYRVSCGNVFVYYENGLDFPERLTSRLNDHEFSFVFMNE